MQKFVEENPVPEGGWLLGRGWDHTNWGQEFPTKEDLDSAFPDVPVYLRRVDGHACWVNSEALRISIHNSFLKNGRSDHPSLCFFVFFFFVSSSSFPSFSLLFQVPPLPEEDPEGGLIVRDQDGDPTGIFIGLNLETLPWSDLFLMEMLTSPLQTTPCG